MKTHLRKLFVGMLCCLLSLVMLCACVPTTPSVDPTDDDTTQSGGDGDDNDKDNDNSNNDDKNDGNEDKTPDTDAERYSYRPVISEEMPVIYINTENGSNDFATWPNRDAKLQGLIDYVGASISVQEEDEVLLDNVEAKVKARGNYTLEYEKKPLRIKFDKKQSMLGLNGGQKFKNWVLLADWKDLSMSNNTTALYLGNTILGSDGYYTSDYRNVELYLNGQYWGVYLLVEQQEAKAESGRTSAPEVEDDYTGTDIGYLVEFDGYYIDERNMPNGDGDPTFELSYGDLIGSWDWDQGLKRHYGDYAYTWNLQRGYTVKSDIYDDAQLTFIQRYVSNAFKIAYLAAYKNELYAFNNDYSDIVPTTGTVQETVSAVIDVQSLVDTYILNEIACDPDINWSSFYISLDMTETGSKNLIFEAPWDFDSAFGIKDAVYGSGRGMFASDSENPWLLLLYHQDWFQQMIKDKWAELRKYGVLKTALELVIEQKTVYKEYYAKNYIRWENRILYGNSELIYELNTYTTQGQAADYLYNWLHTRFNYLNEKWGDGTDVLQENDTTDSPSAHLTFSDIDLIAASTKVA